MTIQGLYLYGYYSEVLVYLFVALPISMACKVCCPHKTGSGRRCKQLTACGVCGAAGVNASSVVSSHR